MKNYNEHHSGRKNSYQLRPTDSGERNMAPSGRYAMGRAPDESVRSYLERLVASASSSKESKAAQARLKLLPDVGPRKRAWLTQTEWRERDALAKAANR